MDEFARQHFAGKKVVGAHIRFRTAQMGRVSEHDAYWNDAPQTLRACGDKVRAALARLASFDAVIFLATDSARVRDFFAREFSNLVTFEKPFARDELHELHEVLPREIAEATVVEMFLLAQSDILVRYPPESYFSFYASLYVADVLAE